MPQPRRTSAPPQRHPHADGAVSALDSHVGFWLRFVSNHVSAAFQARIEAEGVSVSEWVALRHLFDAPDAAPAALVAALGMTKGAVSKIVARLVAKGWAETVAHATDLRAHRIRLTRSGRELVPRLARLADRNDAAFFGPLPAASREELVRLMRELVRIHQLRHVPTD
ncbi:MarR family protein [Variovorax sp. SRS16]|uniref:MarR family winged helix-turn-helix transcriptional regulator n=1 Tax=Variovorax sp. SRS16 TaxID=282217 RepID=UPI0013183228|nr:MarR family winged helix-turn-helix transcriptional regulator [Variovorax sp. SRS16]VTU16757.1 MarR family protein [Variovorax sp. SRS16]